MKYSLIGMIICYLMFSWQLSPLLYRVNSLKACLQGKWPSIINDEMYKIDITVHYENGNELYNMILDNIYSIIHLYHLKTNLFPYHKNMIKYQIGNNHSTGSFYL